ncbi:MAG: polysaccharide biosynthesis tyrosine autokinase [Nocardioidaceae bacterium]
MELRDYLHILAKRWRIAATVVLVCLAAAVAATFIMPPTYEAKTRLFVSVRGSGDLSQLYQGGSFTEQRVKSYADIATSPRVTKPVIDRLGLSLTPAELADKIAAEAPVDTVLINITVSDRSPRRAAEIANAVGQRFTKVVANLETPAGKPSPRSPVKVSVVQQAQPPLSPESPRPLLDIALGLVVGLALGVGLAILRETLDTSVKNADDLSQVTDAPVLAAILRDPTASKHPVARDPHGKRMEAFRQLRTNLQFAAVDHKPRTIIVTSAVADEGKSSVAGNLAVAVAQFGTRVCLVDGDLREPCVAEYFGLLSEIGLTTVLIGHGSVSDVVQPAVRGLDVLASGPVPPNPSELLASERMGAVLAELSERYDLVVVDTPPLLPVTDAAVLAGQTDGALLVTRATRTSRDQAAQAMEALRKVDARVLGAVLNMAPAKGRDAVTYGYAYSYRPSKGRRRREPAPRRHAHELQSDEASTEEWLLGR